LLTEDAPDAAAPGSEADAAATEPDERPTPGDDVVPPPEVPGRTYYVEIFLIGLASLLLEIAYTRVISFKLFYYYTYLVIGLALLGIGSGAVFVSVSKRLRSAATDSVLLWGMLLGALSAGVGYVVIAVVGIDTLAIWDYGTRASFSSIARLFFICIVLYGSFVAVGVMIATLFSRRTERIGRLYFADLLGAGLACAIVVFLLRSIGAPSTIFLAGALLACGSVWVAARQPSKVLVVPGAIVAIALFLGVVAPDVVPDQQLDAAKDQLDEDQVLDSAWSPVFRVDVVEPNDDLRFLYHDGLIGSAIHRWDGELDSLTRFDGDPRSFPFAVGAADGEGTEDVMIIGAAGGNEILASLYYEADRVDAIELNPVTYDLLTDDYAEYSGDLADQPGVNYVNGDGRSFLARSDDEYDLVWYPAPDSYSAANAATAGAFVLSESYLYTSDAIEDSLEHLRDDGILAAQFGEFDYANKPNRTARYVVSARHALDARGVEDPTQHILVATTPGTSFGAEISTILVKPTPFTEAEVAALEEQIGAVADSQLQYAPGAAAEGPVGQIASMPDDEVDDFLADYPYEVDAITDDGPFFWHFNAFPDVISNVGDPIDRGDFEDSVGERVLLLLLVVAALLAAVFLLLPFVAIRSTWTTLPHKGRSALYFGALGMGFFFYEITLIQKLTLFLGYPTYSLTVTLASILVFTGVGALLSERFQHQRGRVVAFLATALVVLTAFYAFLLGPLTDALLGGPLGVRVLVAFLVMAPLGVCLGMFMPLGLGAVSRLSEHGREYVAWGWAVNGFASVIGAVLTTILAMRFGFSAVLLVALAVYGVALLVLRGLIRDADVAEAARGDAGPDELDLTEAPEPAPA